MKTMLGWWSKAAPILTRRFIPRVAVDPFGRAGSETDGIQYFADPFLGRLPLRPAICPQKMRFSRADKVS